MTIPGVGVTTAATLIAAIGDIHRFSSAKKLVGYLGLDPRVRQSGQAPARQGRISKQGSSASRHVLVEAAWSAIKTPGPLRAFYQRTRARRGAQIAIVATARKLAALCWQLLTTQQDYAFKRQTIIERKLRALELLAGAPTRHGHQHQTGTPTIKQRADAEQQLTQQAEIAYERLIKDWTSTRPSPRLSCVEDSRNASRLGGVHSRVPAAASDAPVPKRQRRLPLPSRRRSRTGRTARQEDPAAPQEGLSRQRPGCD